MGALFSRKKFNAMGAGGGNPFTNGDASDRAKVHGNGAIRRTMPLSGILGRMAQRVLHERVKLKPRKRGGNGRLKEEQVKEIRLRFARGESVSKLAEEYHFGESSMKAIIDGITYAWVI